MSSATSYSPATGYAAMSSNESSWSQSYNNSWQNISGVPLYTIAHSGRVQATKDHSQIGYNISAPQGACISQGRVVFNIGA